MLESYSLWFLILQSTKSLIEILISVSHGIVSRHEYVRLPMHSLAFFGKLENFWNNFVLSLEFRFTF